MSPFREALKAAGHGEWIIEMISESGEVRLRKINERALEVHLAIALHRQRTASFLQLPLETADLSSQRLRCLVEATTLE
jgi:hypothetical protein